MNGGGENQIAQKRYSKAEALEGPEQLSKRSQTAKRYVSLDFSKANIRRTNFLVA